MKNLSDFEFGKDLIGHIKKSMNWTYLSEKSC